MDKVKVVNKKTKVVKEVEKSIASDYIGTGEWDLLKKEKTGSNILDKRNNKNNETESIENN